MSEITAGKRRFVKRQLSGEHAFVSVGKGRVSEPLIKEIGKRLDKNKMVKVKILKTALVNEDAKQMAQRIAGLTGSALVEVRGHTFMLYKSRKK